MKKTVVRYIGAALLIGCFSSGQAAHLQQKNQGACISLYLSVNKEMGQMKMGQDRAAFNQSLDTQKNLCKTTL